MKWVEALKEYAKQHGKYVVPKKGSPEYEAVRKLMGASTPAAAKEEKKEEPKKAEPKAEGTKKGQPRKTARKAFEDLPAKAPEAKPKRSSKAKKAAKHDGMEEMKALENAPPKRKSRAKKVLREAGGVTYQADAKSSNPEVLLNNAVNVHEPIAPPAALGGDLSQLKAEVQKVRKPRALPRLIEPETVKSDTPFSFGDLKKRIYGN